MSTDFKSPQEEFDFINDLVDKVKWQINFIRANFTLKYERMYKEDHPRENPWITRLEVEEARCENEYKFFLRAMERVITPEIASKAELVDEKVRAILKKHGIPVERSKRETDNNRHIPAKSHKEILEKQRESLRRAAITLEHKSAKQTELVLGLPQQPVAIPPKHIVANNEQIQDTDRCALHILDQPMEQLMEEAERESEHYITLVRELSMKRRRHTRRFV